MAGISKANQAIEAKERREIEVPIGFLFFPKKDDKNWGDLWHPRGDLPPDPAIVQDIIDQGGVEKPIIVWQQVAVGGEVYVDGDVAKKGDSLLIVGDGSQRTAAAVAAQPIMRKKGMLGEGKRDLFVPITKFAPATSETAVREFLLLRQAHDADRLKKLHKPSVIAHNLRMAQKHGATEDQLLGVCPKFPVPWSKNIMDAALDWGSLHPDAAKAFDDGINAKNVTRQVPIGLLPVILLNFSRGEHLAKLTELTNAGISGMKGFTRRMNAERPAESAEVDEGWENQAEEHGPASGPITPEAPPTGQTLPAKPERKKRSETGRRPKKRVEKALEMLSADKGGNVLKGEGGTTAEAHYFALGMSYEVGQEVDLKGLPRELKSFLAGVGWVTGAEEKVPAIVRDAYDRVQEEATKPKAHGPGKGKGKRGIGKKKRGPVETLEVD